MDHFAALILAACTLPNLVWGLRGAVFATGAFLLICVLGYLGLFAWTFFWAGPRSNEFVAVAGEGLVATFSLCAFCIAFEFLCLPLLLVRTVAIMIWRGNLVSEFLEWIRD